ncbi:MAG: HD domain-containing phosphohydrolase, partial [Ornithinimicrobium sp.]
RVKFDSLWVTHGLTFTSIVFLGVMLVRDASWPPTDSVDVTVWLMVSLIVIIVADSRPITIVNGRKVEPVGMTVSIAMAMTTVLPGPVNVDVSAGYIALVAGLGSTIAATRRLALFGHLPVPSDIAMRVLVTGLVATTVQYTWPGGQSLRVALVTWDPVHHWALALALAGIAAAGLGLQMLFWSYERAAQEHTVLRHAVADEIKAVGPIGMGVVSGAVSTALATRAVGPAAMAIFVLPLILLMIAVRRQAHVVDGQRQTVWALSKLTDQGGFTDPGHAARVARLAVPVGRQVGLSEPALRDLEYAALLHDLGQLSLQRPIPGGATTHTSALDQRRVAAAGSALLARTAELSKVSAVVAHQATPYWRLKQLGDIPIASRILRVANAYDDLVGVSLDSVTRMRALQRLRLGMGYDYDPRVLRELCRVLVRDGQISREDLLSLELWPSRAQARA